MPRSNKHTKTRKKKNKQKPTSSTPSVPISTDDLLVQAEAAMDASNYEIGLNYYSQVCEILQTQLSSIPSTSLDDMDTTNDNAETKLLLAKVLSRSGEARVSLGDVESGREQFIEAISLLQNEDEVDNDNNPHDPKKEQLYEIRASVHLYLAQLSCGEEALTSCQKGITDLESCLKSMEARFANNVNQEQHENHDIESFPEVALMDIRKQICSAHCTVAELYLTDLCYDPNAESECEKALITANEYDSLLLTSSDMLSQKLQQSNTASTTSQNINFATYRHPDALQAMANLRLSQSRGVEASKIMMKAYERMRVGCTAMSKLVGLGEVSKELPNANDVMEEEETAKELEHVDEATSLPSYEFRCQSAKLLLECGSILHQANGVQNGSTDMETEDAIPETQNSCSEAAIQVLGSLLAENDEVIEIWYLMGCAFQAIENNETAKQYFERALEMLKKVKEGLEQDDDDDDDDDVEQQLEEIEAQMEDIQEKILHLDCSEEMDEE